MNAWFTVVLEKQMHMAKSFGIRKERPVILILVLFWSGRI
jgi:hypothetical protein